MVQPVDRLQMEQQAAIQFLIQSLPQVVAAVSGHALGGGAMMALAADIRIFADGAFRFGLNEVQIGLFVPSYAIELARAAGLAVSTAHRLLTTMQQAGFVLEIALGVPVDHATSTTSVKFPDLMALTGEDAELYASKRR